MTPRPTSTPTPYVINIAAVTAPGRRPLRAGRRGPLRLPDGQLQLSQRHPGLRHGQRRRRLHVHRRPGLHGPTPSPARSSPPTPATPATASWPSTAAASRSTTASPATTWAQVDTDRRGHSVDLTVYIHKIHGPRRDGSTLRNAAPSSAASSRRRSPSRRPSPTAPPATRAPRARAGTPTPAATPAPAATTPSRSRTGAGRHDGSTRAAPAADDLACAGCHRPGAPSSATHTNPAELEATKLLPVIDSITSGGPGQNPVVTFRIVDPTSPAGCSPAAASTTPPARPSR